MANGNEATVLSRLQDSRGQISSIRETINLIAQQLDGSDDPHTDRCVQVLYGVAALAKATHRMIGDVEAAIEFGRPILDEAA